MSAQTWVQQDAQPSVPVATPHAPIPRPHVAGPGPGPPTPRGPNGTTNDPSQESLRAKFVTGPGYVVPAPSFSYNVISKSDSSGSSQHSPSTPAIKFTPSTSAASLQPPVPGQSSVSGPSFSYNIGSNATVGSPSGQQFQSSTATTPSISQSGKFTPASAASLQPPVPVSSMPAPVQPPLSVPKGNSSPATGFSYSGSSQSPAVPESLQKNPSSNSVCLSTSAAGMQGATAAPSAPSTAAPLAPSTAAPLAPSTAAPLAPSTAQSMPLPVHISPNSLTTIRTPTATSFSAPVGMPGTPGTPGPPGMPLSATLSSSVSIKTSAVGSSPASLRPILPSPAPVPTPLTSQNVQQQLYPVYASLPSMVSPPPALWLHPPQIGGLQRPPFLPYPGVFPGPFPLPLRPMPPPAVPLPDSQPPGVSPIGSLGGASSTIAGSSQPGSSLETQLPPGIVQKKQANDVPNKDVDVVHNEKVDAWTAHKTEEGTVYYHNAFTQKSTYIKPLNFKGEAEKVNVQSTPVSWEKLAGTEWMLVTTNDGKTYYYHDKDKISSWHVPQEVADLKKKQANESSKTNTVSTPNVGVLTDKGLAPTSLSTPAISMGGRESASLRASGSLVASSALDLIKRKLQDVGTPAASSPLPASSVPVTSDLNGSRVAETMGKGPQSENSKDRLKDVNGDGNLSESSSDSDDVDSGPTKEECVIQFKEMLKERGVAPFSKWDKELPKILFDPRFKGIPSYTERRSLFEHYVRTRAEEERKEKRAAQKAALEGFKQLLEEASEDIDYKTDYEAFKRKWGHDPRFKALDRKDRELLLNERILPLRKAFEDKFQAIRAAAVSSFKSMLQDNGDINTSSRWSKVKDSLRNDPRYKSVKHEDREVLFNEYISEIKAAELEAERAAKAKREEEEKLKERERETRKRKEREEQEMERVRLKARRKDAGVSYQALLTEKIKDPKASWTESKPKLEKDPLGRATNSDLEQADMEKLFREHVKTLYERCAREFRALLSEVLTEEAAKPVSDDGKNVLNSWSTAKRLLKPDSRYSKMPRKERESLWRRYAEEMLRRQKAAPDPKEEKAHQERNRSVEPAKRSPTTRRSHGRR